MSSWDPTSPIEWAKALGLLQLSLFARSDSREGSTGDSVLLDGPLASLHFRRVESIEESLDDRNLAWSWSSNLANTITVSKDSDFLLLRRWDDRLAIRKFDLPDRPAQAERLLSILRGIGRPAAGDAVLHVLRAFRVLREVANNDPLSALHLFNACLHLSDAVDRGLIPPEELRSHSRISDLSALIQGLPESYAALEATGVPEIPIELYQSDLGQAIDYFLQPEPRQLYRLVPSLLLRHASGQLFQEAHLALERESTLQAEFPGWRTPAASPGTLRRDVRFTPTTLARALVQQALHQLSARGGLPTQLDVLDPACGSGVFLLEAVRELSQSGYKGAACIRGLDISPVSVSMAKFSLHHAIAEAATEGLTITAEIHCADALATAWPSAHVVLMNPPFIPWEALSKDERVQLSSIDSSLASGSPDKALGFLFRAVASTHADGVIASVLPSPLLDTTRGVKWRDTLLKSCSIELLGLFRGFGYFRASRVEPSFLVMRKGSHATKSEATKVLVAEETHEDESLRALRLLRPQGQPDVEAEGFEIYSRPKSSFSKQTWRPRRLAAQRLAERLVALRLPKVRDLFVVHQGTRTGSNESFLLSRSQLQSLPKRERKYFRPAASNSTLRDCRLVESTYVFFPYGKDGLSLGNLDEVRAAVPTFYDEHLAPNKQALLSRAGIDTEKWWMLTREREWQRIPCPKLVSTYFGMSGSFAYDESGLYVVVQGHGWIPRSASARRSFSSGSRLPQAYVAVLNSDLFERFLSLVCPQVAGGQFDLSARYIGNAFLPDLDEASTSVSSLVRKLASAGELLAAGKLADRSEVNRLVAEAFRLGVEEALEILE